MYTQYLFVLFVLFFSASLWADSSLPNGEWMIISLPSKPPAKVSSVEKQGTLASLEKTQDRTSSLQKRSDADVLKVSVTGSETNYTFAVTLKSDDVGWDQYADRWEVLNANGDLIYKRVLAHPHVNEQPFTRSGGPVNVTKNEKIYIRAHLTNKGYIGDVLVGSVEDGFKLVKERA